MKGKAPKKRKAESGKRKRRGPGQPTLFRPEYLERVHDLCLLGKTDAELAVSFGVSESTLNNWKRKHPEFLESMHKGKDAADGRVAKALFHRALGYSHPAVKIFNDQGAPLVVDYVEHYPPDTAAAQFWLKNRQPGHWRDRHEVSGPDGGPIKFAQLSDAELEAIATGGGGGGGTVAPA